MVGLFAATPLNVVVAGGGPIVRQVGVVVPPVIDEQVDQLFAGPGGDTLGVVKAGFTLVV